MKKTKEIKNALYRRVKIEFYDGDILTGWLVPSSWCKNEYDLLPLNKNGNITTFCVSDITHICFLHDGCRLW